MANQYRESKAPEKRSYKQLEEIHIRKLAGGGHIVSHHHKSDGMSMSAPKEHAFSKEDGAGGATHAHMIAHMAKMGIHPGSAEAKEEVAENESPAEMKREETVGEEA